MAWLLRRILMLWVRFITLPADAAARADRARQADLLCDGASQLHRLCDLNSACVKLKLPRPRKRLLPGGLRTALVLLSGSPRLRQRTAGSAPPAAAGEAGGPCCGRIRAPMSTWCRRRCSGVARRSARPPGSGCCWWMTGSSPSRVRRLFQVIFNGRRTLLEIDEPVSLRSLLGNDAPTVVQCRPGRAGALRVRYARQRAARIGPDLSHRRTIVGRILRMRAVRAAVAQEVREEKTDPPPGPAARAQARLRDRRQLFAGVR